MQRMRQTVSLHSIRKKNSSKHFLAYQDWNWLFMLQKFLKSLNCEFQNLKILYSIYVVDYQKIRLDSQFF